MQREVYKVDAKGQVLGRMATDIAMHLMGKHRADYQPHIDFGDTVQVVNIKEVKITGNKLDQKKYFHHTLHPGGIKEKVMGKLFQEDPAEVLRLAVSRMLPKNKLRNDRMKRLMIS
ncbi:MAG: 50S ribosomal protein L13 [Patescibacteria group bacterium]|nr:50S ribosomal protein L13 [Patescibacteria group bacterium]